MIITDLHSIGKRIFKRNTRNFFVPFCVNGRRTIEKEQEQQHWALQKKKRKISSWIILLVEKTHTHAHTQSSIRFSNVVGFCCLIFVHVWCDDYYYYQ